MAGKILSIRVKRIVDESPDISTLGDFTDTPSDWAIIRHGPHAGTFVRDLPEDAELPERGQEYRFFKPYAVGETPGSPDFRKYGPEDWKRAEGLNRGDWHYVGIAAELTYTTSRDGNGIIQSLRSGGLWGIESDSGDDYFRTIAAEELAALRDEAKAMDLPWPARMAKAAREDITDVG